MLGSQAELMVQVLGENQVNKQHQQQLADTSAQMTLTLISIHLRDLGKQHFLAEIAGGVLYCHFFVGQEGVDTHGVLPIELGEAWGSRDSQRAMAAATSIAKVYGTNSLVILYGPVLAASVA
jgi:exopolyphosphatase/pppGpp-phosphohydrolase